MTSLPSGAAAVRSDEELIIASREDPQAFRELYDRWAEAILASQGGDAGCAATQALSLLSPYTAGLHASVN